MSASNPSITASDIITDVEVRLGSPNISSSNYFPWISYGYQKTWAALANAGQTVKEQLFGAYVSYTLTPGTGEYTLTTIAPRFSSVIKAEILYGASGDLRTPLFPIRSLANWKNMGNVSTSYQSKASPLFYIIGNTIGFIPTPPASDSAATLYLWYVQRPYQITATTDVIDIPYRFLYPIVNYVQSKAIQKENEDYATALEIEQRFERELDQVGISASSEYNENDGMSAVEIDSSNALFDDPLKW